MRGDYWTQPSVGLNKRSVVELDWLNQLYSNNMFNVWPTRLDKIMTVIGTVGEDRTVVPDVKSAIIPCVIICWFVGIAL